MELHEALYTTRAMRRVASDPIPDDVVAAMMDAAIRAPSGGNSQNWRWVTVTERSTMGALGDLYREAWTELNRTFYKGKVDAARERGDDTTLRVMDSAEWLADNFATVPLVVFAYHRNDPTGASIYPAVWNMMLAARGHGVGTTLTTVLGIFKAAEVSELLAVPVDKGWENAAAVTCGYPLGRWGVAKRPPPQDVTYAERWGEPPPWHLEGPMWQP
jgi:nitroreductase